MALSTYSDLQTAIADFLARSDLASKIPDFIEMCEARMSRELNTRSQEGRTTLTTSIGTEYVTLPTDLRELRLVKINSDPITVLDSLSAQQLYSKYSSSAGAKPVAYCVVGTQLIMRPVPDAVYSVELLYSDGVEALTDENTTNTVLTRHPDAYLYGTLAAAYVYLMDEQRAAQYDGMFSRILEEIKKDTDKARHGGGGLTMNSDYVGA